MSWSKTTVVGLLPGVSLSLHVLQKAVERHRCTRPVGLGVIEGMQMPPARIVGAKHPLPTFELGKRGFAGFLVKKDLYKGQCPDMGA